MMQSFSAKCTVAAMIVRLDWSRVISEDEFSEACVNCKDDEMTVIWLKIETNAERSS